MAYGLIRIYQSQGKISGGKFDWMARASLGNFQGAQTLCVSQFYSMVGKDQDIKCPRGNLNIAHFGYVAGGKDQMLKATGPFTKYSEKDRKFQNNFCGNPDYLEDKDNCGAALKMDEIKKAFGDMCGGKDKCKFNLKDSAFFDNAKLKEHCEDKDAQLYMQVNCRMEPKE